MVSKLDRRRKKILDLLADVPISSTQQLAETTQVSTETMRKDLDALAEEGLIVKVHGGVALASGGVSEIPFDLRVTKNAEAKRKIAKQAVLLIQRGDNIVLESCTTNLELAKALVQKPELLETLVIVTNSFSIASVFDGGRKCKKLFFLGGLVNPVQYASMGHQTAKMLREFHVSKAFLSGAALSDHFVLTGYYDEDVAFQKNALYSAQEVILMIDSSKLGMTAVLTVAHLSEFDYLITDKELSAKEKDLIVEQGVHYIPA